MDKRVLLPTDFSKNALNAIRYVFVHTLTDLKVQSGISAFIESRESDMIAFVNKKHSFFGSIFSRLLVKEMGYHSKIPVLTLNDVS